MRSLFCFFCFIFTGCAVTRTAIVDPARAAELGDRADVVSINGYPNAGHIHHDGNDYALVDAAGSRISVARDARIKVDITYDDGDMIPGEGVVRSGRTRALGVSSGIALVVGSLFTVMGVMGASGPPPTCESTALFGCLGMIDTRPLSAALAVFGGVISVTGIGLLIGAAALGVRIDPVATSRGIAFRW